MGFTLRIVIFLMIIWNSDLALAYLGTGTIGEVTTEWNGAYFDFVVNGTTNGCGTLGQDYYGVNPNQPRYKEIVALVMTAKASGRSLIVVTDGTCMAGWGQTSGLANVISVGIP